jgi:hypothetical protein
VEFSVNFLKQIEFDPKNGILKLPRGKGKPDPDAARGIENDRRQQDSLRIKRRAATN